MAAVGFLKTLASEVAARPGTGSWELSPGEAGPARTEADPGAVSAVTAHLPGFTGDSGTYDDFTLFLVPMDSPGVIREKKLGSVPCWISVMRSA